MYVIGTAGHIDHGKTTLVKALSNIDPDRLPQEKDRGMTIDLGFAWLQLPSERIVSIVDVPGHERFIKNMLAGIGGIDLGLLVIAADEGVMPQTREHLAILNLLQIKSIMVVITKIDLVENELLELVKLEVKEILNRSIFGDAPVVSVSANSGHGISLLMDTIDDILTDQMIRKDIGDPRLAIDRSFSLAGFGTIVTGTLIDGSLKVGQEIEILPLGRRVRIRGLQSHNSKMEMAGPGRRIAVNLPGISHHKIQRGEMIALPGALKPTKIIDARLKLISNVPRPLKHNTKVRIHILTTETGARIRLLDTKMLLPQEEGWVQIHLEHPIATKRGDFFILRSGNTTIGGGKVVDAYPSRHRLFIPTVLENLRIKEKGTPDEIALAAIDQWGPCDLSTLSQKINQPQEDVINSIRVLSNNGQIICIGEENITKETRVYSNQAWTSLEYKVVEIISEYHNHHRLRKGMPREELRSRLKLSASNFTNIVSKLSSDGTIRLDSLSARLSNHEISLTQTQKHQVNNYLIALEASPYSPPTDYPLDTELLAMLIEEGKVVKVDETIVFTGKVYQEMTTILVDYINKHSTINVAIARTLLDSSRKYVLPLLEYMDQQHITKRVGDNRVLR